MVVRQRNVTNLVKDTSQPSLATWLKIGPVGERYSETDFKVLTRGRDKLHLSVLEAMYIYALEPARPVLCKQKLSVTNFTLFQHAHAGNK